MRGRMARRLPRARLARLCARPSARPLPLRPCKLLRGRRAVRLAAADGFREVESLKIDPKTRTKVEGAVERLSLQATAGDVAAATGVSLFEADRALKAIAADSLGTLKVTEDGEVLYVFSKDFRNALRSKSLRIRLEPALAKARNALSYLTRVSFGTALLASIAIVFAAIVVISTSSQQSDRRDNRRSFYGPRFYFSPYDLLWYWDPYYYRRQQSRMARGEEMNVLEAIFSFVFGDGDPNFDLEERRWKMIALVIKDSGGVVTAEQLLPYLDLPGEDETGEQGSGLAVDESVVLPVLQKFDGTAQVDGDGGIVYSFPDLQDAKQVETKGLAGLFSKGGAGAEPYLSERKWEFSRAAKSQQVMAVALGVMNVVGIVTLQRLLFASGIPLPVLARQYGGVVELAVALMPALQVYAAGFFAIPLVRWLTNRGRVERAEDRNRARYRASLKVHKPDPALKRKLASARDFARRLPSANRAIAYSSDIPQSEAKAEDDLADFDRRLGQG